ncbi:DUF2513 domain-containing protein [Lysinibacillus irui]|uniref:DUF2513 domain-containing protein n=1 Tax=Lysinibacillus irui TaxID=2998077 RepID=A0ABU5NFR1_9BACI|nr:DUF2513 domain-containing protein [Lysinibacillus irui]MEA0554191.1 DUF2513 domain-containing protein [Lysinibacillus irui]MEA0974867.1 DUF2513 domain-containing protein [Lysinibacillus irui]MEA1041021.1 DUF2513 domain-containing protein [Lysinibacillus irui]
MELVRKLLIDTADNVSEYNLIIIPDNQGQVEQAERDKLIKYHLEIMRQNHLLDFEAHDYLDGSCSIINVQLTWAGQDYLSNIEDDTIWSKTKSVAQEKGLEIAKLSFDLLKNLAAQQAKQLLGIE